MRIDIIRILSESNIISHLEYSEIIKELESMIATSVSWYIEKKLWTDRYNQIMIQLGCVKVKSDDTKKTAEALGKDNNVGDASKLWLVFNTLYKLVAEAKTLFVDEQNRLKYIGYILVFFILVFSIWWWLYVINKNPNIFPKIVLSDINEINVIWNDTNNVQQNNNSTVNNNIANNKNSNTFPKTIESNVNKIEVIWSDTSNVQQNNNSTVNNNVANHFITNIHTLNEKRLISIEEKIDQILVFFQFSSATVYANASATVSIINDKSNELVLLKKELNSLSPDKLSHEQKIKAEEVSKKITYWFKKLIELWKLKNYPKDNLEEISSVNKIENGAMIYSTMYPDVNLWFSTYYEGNIWTFVEFIAPKAKTFLITCNNLVSWMDLKEVKPIYLRENCNFDDVKYIHPLFINKPINNYWISNEYINEIQKTFRLNLSDVTQHNCWELHCLQYNEHIRDWGVTLNNNPDNIQYQIYPFEDFKIRTISIK